MRPDFKVQSKSKNTKWLLTILLIVLAFGIGNFTGENGYLRRDNLSRSDQQSAVDNELPEDLDYGDIEKLYDIVRKNYDGDLTGSDFYNELKQGIARATGDPYTEFFTASEATDFNQELGGSFTGIGAELGKEEGNLVVVSPLSGYPAEKAGIRPKDVIARINDEDSSDFSVFQAVTKIRGEAGTDVTLTLVRGQSEVIEVTITRELIDVPSVKYEILGDIGVITISQFSDDTSGLLESASKDLKNKNVKGIVLDMRGNPGGYLEEAVKVAGVWLSSDKLVVEVRKGSIVQESLFAKGSNRLGGIPAVVLINEGSASASEIVAGALQDHKVATIIGAKSFGKGSVQNISKLTAGELIKITTSRWYTPNGNNIDKEGIKPDIEVELTEEDFEAGNDPQLDKALEILK